MKNKLIIASTIFFGAAAMTSCAVDTEPRIEKPTEFKLNGPSVEESIYVFDADENGNCTRDITFTVDHPDYGGVVTTTVYQVQIAKSVADFEAWDESQLAVEPDIASSPEGAEAPAAEDALPLTAMVDMTTTSTSITLDGEKFCMAVNEIYGLTMQNVKDEPHPVAVRVHASVENAEYADVWSNAITINVRSYVKPVPDQIWLVGAPQGWNIAGDPDWILEETEVGSKIYTGDFNIKAGDFMFRFYDVPGDWDHFCIGSQSADSPLDIVDADGNPVETLTEEGVIVPCLQEANGVNPKGSWNIPNWPGGKVHIEIDLNVNQVKFALGQAKKVWIIGQCEGWDINGKPEWALRETEDGSNVYEGTFEINAGDFQFRFYTATGDWETNSIGSQVEDSAVDITVVSEGTIVDAVAGKGSWKDDSWAGGKCAISLDLNTMKVSFTKL